MINFSSHDAAYAENSPPRKKAFAAPTIIKDAPHQHVTITVRAGTLPAH
jgi:hypothetical protein